MTVSLATDLPRFLTIPEAASLLRIGRTKCFEMARSGELPGAFTIRKQVRVDRDELLSAIREQATGALR